MVTLIKIRLEGWILKIHPTVEYPFYYGWITHQARHAAEIDAVYILMRIILLIGNKTHKSYQYQKLGYLVGGADG